MGKFNHSHGLFFSLIDSQLLYFVHSLEMYQLRLQQLRFNSVYGSFICKCELARDPSFLSLSLRVGSYTIFRYALLLGIYIVMYMYGYRNGLKQRKNIISAKDKIYNHGINYTVSVCSDTLYLLKPKSLCAILK